MLFADVVATTQALRESRSRKSKTTAIASLLAQCADDDEAACVATWLTASTRQGRLGVGWAALYRSGEPLVGTATTASLTVAHVDDVFTALANISGEGSNTRRAELLASLYRNLTREEGDLVRGLLSGELRTGALGGVVLDAIATSSGIPSELVRRAYLLTGDIGATAAIARHGIEAIQTIQLTVGRGIAPMLASTAKSLEDGFATFGESSVEWKLDGARIQVHRNQSDVWIFTRNLNDITERLPQVVEIARSFTVDSFVLDGEVLGLDLDGNPRPFQRTISEFATDSATPPEAGLMPFFFDCMYADGLELLDTPLRERLTILEGIVGDRRIPGVITTSIDEARSLQHDALTRGHEGVMVKDSNSVYDAGRRGSTWLKVKPVRTFDLVVLAAEWGHGRRNGWLSNLHLGARVESTGEFVMVGKTFKGLTDALLAWQTEAFLERESRRTPGTVWVRPELVVEIAIDGVQQSTRYPGGVALRFARVKSYRTDKNASEADTIESLQDLLP